MDVVSRFVAADGVHIRVKTFAERKSVFLEGVAFPFCKGLYNLCAVIVLLENAEGNRALITV